MRTHRCRRLILDDERVQGRPREYIRTSRRYAKLRSLYHLSADQEVPYLCVREDDARPKHVHKKYKLRLDEFGETWRIVRAAP